jgi:hypothetical protein
MFQLVKYASKHWLKSFKEELKPLLVNFDLKCHS